MRLGEQKQIIDRVVGENSTIQLEHENRYGGQAQRISNYADVLKALEVISEYEWSGFDTETFKAFLNKYTRSKAVILPQEDFNTLQDMVNKANQNLPIFYSILDSMVDPQNKHAINIKLPEGVSSLEELSKENKKLQDVLKLYNVDGQFDFKGFDRGSEWYVVVAAGVLSYKFLIAGLDIAQKYFEMRKACNESKTAELDYRAAIDKAEVTTKEVEEYVDRKLKLLVESEVKTAIEKIGIGTNDKNEISVKLIMATTALIKELDAGTEFHLSLNPPAYASEKEGRIQIDYTQIKPLIEKKDAEVKQIEPVKKIEGAG